MRIIPAINCAEASCVRERLGKASHFSDWVHFDIADGRFTPNKTWGSAEAVSDLVKEFPDISFEAHLMIREVEGEVSDWISSGVRRLIFQWEALEDPEKFISSLAAEKQIGVSLSPETPIDEIKPHLERFDFFQILAVKPGLAGQNFDQGSLEKIKSLRLLLSGDKIIEADGGINLETGKLVKEAGADIIVSASYIFDSADPEENFKSLSAL